MKNKRRMIQGDDILWAMRSTGFDHYATALQPYMDKYLAEKESKGRAMGSNEDEPEEEEEEEEEDGEEGEEEVEEGEEDDGDGDVEGEADEEWRSWIQY